jgi:branched-chain amino acid transport system substrate-binding protein
MSKVWQRCLSAAVAAGALGLAAAAGAEEKEIVFGLPCDRTGPTQTVGVFLCPGYHGYIALLNSSYRDVVNKHVAATN